MLRLDARLVWTLAGTADVTARHWTRFITWIRAGIGGARPVSSNIVVKARTILPVDAALHGVEAEAGFAEEARAPVTSS